MSELRDNGRPPAPEGFAGTRADDARAEDKGLVLASEAPQVHRDVPWWAGLVCCLVAGALMAVLPDLVCVVAIAYGAAVVLDRGPLWGRVAAVVGTLAVSGVAVLLAAPGAAASSLAFVALALASAGLARRGRLTSGACCLLVAGSALAVLAVAELAARAEGTSLSQVATSSLDTHQGSLVGQTAEVAAEAQTLRELVGLLWPINYVVASACELLCAYAGLALAQRQGAPGFRLSPLRDFDLPFWVLVVLAVDVTALLAGATVDTWPYLAHQVTSVVLMALRLAFAFQGFAVLAWFLYRRNVSAAGRAAILAMAFVLEVQLVIMTIVGLLDAWRNYRQLPRGRGRVTVQGPANKESAHAD